MIDWNFEKVAKLTELATNQKEFTETEIANKMIDDFGIMFSRDAIKNKIARLNLRKLLNKPVTNTMPYYTKYKSIIEDEYSAIHKVAHVEGFKLSLPFNSCKILHLGDMHIPFHLDDQVQLAANRNAGADVVVLNEMLDCYSLSTFNKSLSIPFEIEIDNAIRMLEWLSENFPLVVIILGNHLDRIGRDFKKNVNPSLMFLLKDAMSYIAKPFSNVIITDQPLLQINSTLFTHAEFFSAIELKAGVKMFNFATAWQEALGLDDFDCVVQAHCLSDDTEILTKDGWKKHDEIIKGEQVLTLNTDSDVLEYNGINEIFKYDNYTEMLSFKGRKDLDLLVTPDHRMIVKERDGSGYGECKAKDFKKYGIIPLAGNYNGEELPYSDDVLRLIGFIIAEGGFQSGGIRLYQNWSNKELVTSLLEKAGIIDYTISKKEMKGRAIGEYVSIDDEAVVYIKAEHAKSIIDRLDNEKNIPLSFMGINKNQFKVLLDGMMIGDGTYYPDKNGGQYFTSNKILADRLQELCIKNNIKSSVNEREGHEDGIQRKTRYVVTWLEKNSTSYQNEVEVVPYSGIAWCVNVTNGTIVVRRNGRAAIVGNTHMLGAVYKGSVKVMESGCLCRIPDYALDKFYGKPQNNGYVVVEQKRGRTDFDLTREFWLPTPKYIPQYNPVKDGK